MRIMANRNFADNNSSRISVNYTHRYKCERTKSETQKKGNRAANTVSPIIT